MLLNFNATPHPPRLALPVGVGIGKTTAMQRAVAGLLRSDALGGRKIVIGVPRHDLAEEQRAAFWSLDVDAMVWKGRSAPDPSPDNPDRLMCLDPSAPFDAMEVERIVETTSCKVTQRGTTHICPFYKSCGYQAQKRQLDSAQVVLTAHDTLFHKAPKELGAVGLLILDEGFWNAGLRGMDGKALLTLDGLRPDEGTVRCWTVINREDCPSRCMLCCLGKISAHQITMSWPRVASFWKTRPTWRRPFLTSGQAAKLPRSRIRGGGQIAIIVISLIAICPPPPRL